MHEVQALDEAGNLIKVVCTVETLAEANETAGKLNLKFQGVEIDGKKVGGYVVVSD
jgi:hypothetical protein